eukprot:scaffold682568_cov50-Prasinocladus_malaysianus.AAC.1
MYYEWEQGKLTEGDDYDSDVAEEELTPEDKEMLIAKEASIRFCVVLIPMFAMATSIKNDISQAINNVFDCM